MRATHRVAGARQGGPRASQPPWAINNSCRSAGHALADPGAAVARSRKVVGQEVLLKKALADKEKEYKDAGGR